MGRKVSRWCWYIYVRLDSMLKEGCIWGDEMLYTVSYNPAESLRVHGSQWLLHESHIASAV
jgi:hypothetical protein